MTQVAHVKQAEVSQSFSVLTLTLFFDSSVMIRQSRLFLKLRRARGPNRRLPVFQLQKRSTFIILYATKALVKTQSLRAITVLQIS